MNSTFCRLLALVLFYEPYIRLKSHTKIMNKIVSKCGIANIIMPLQ